MKGIILCQSKYGATRKYAQWLAVETGFDCVETKRASLAMVRPCDAILLGGGVYASVIAGLSFLRRHIGALQGRRILVFCDGASPRDAETLQALAARNMQGPLAGVPCFYCRGALDMAAMNPLDRGLCNMLRKAAAAKRPEERTALECALLEAGDGRRDWTDPAYLRPVLEALRR